MTEQYTCPRCQHSTKFNGLCTDCMLAELEDHDDGDCWQCDGQGYTYDCFEEYACVDPEGGCDLCMRRCDVCKPRAALTEGARDG